MSNRSKDLEEGAEGSNSQLEKHKEQEEQPHKFADGVYEGICQDTEEQSSSKGKQTFRDIVFEHCNTSSIILQNVRMGSKGCLALVRLIRNSPVIRVDLANNHLGDIGVLPVLGGIKSMASLKHVNLAGNGIGNDGGANIAVVLNQNNSLW